MTDVATRREMRVAQKLTGNARRLESLKELPKDMFDRPAQEDSEPPSRPAQARLKLRFPLLFLRPPALPAFFVGACGEPDRAAGPAEARQP